MQLVPALVADWRRGLHDRGCDEHLLPLPEQLLFLCESICYIHIDEKIVLILFNNWAYFAFALAAYASEFTDRLAFYKNVRIQRVRF